MEVANGLITRIDFSRQDGTLSDVLEPWSAWMYDRDPELAQKMLRRLNGWPVLTEESAPLWLEFLPIYIAEGL